MIKNALITHPVTLVSGVLILLLSACGGSSTPTASTTPEASPSATTPAPATSSPSPTASASPSAEAGLTIEKSVLAKKGDDGKLKPVEDGVFKRGDEVYLVLLNVGKFKEGSDGKNKFDLDLEAKDPSGKVILDKKQGLGEQGHVNLPNGVAQTPYGSLITKADMEAGKYTLTLTIYDKVGGGKASETKTFTLE